MRRPRRTRRILSITSPPPTQRSRLSTSLDGLLPLLPCPLELAAQHGVTLTQRGSLLLQRDDTLRGFLGLRPHRVSRLRGCPGFRLRLRLLLLLLLQLLLQRGRLRLFLRQLRRQRLQCVGMGLWQGVG